MLTCFILGRTTFVNTLCGRRVLQPKDDDDAASAHLEEGIRIKPVTVGMSLKTQSAIILWDVASSNNQQ